MADGGGGAARRGRGAALRPARGGHCGRARRHPRLARRALGVRGMGLLPADGERRAAPLRPPEADRPRHSRAPHRRRRRQGRQPLTRARPSQPRDRGEPLVRAPEYARWACGGARPGARRGRLGPLPAVPLGPEGGERSISALRAQEQGGLGGHARGARGAGPLRGPLRTTGNALYGLQALAGARGTQPLLRQMAVAIEGSSEVLYPQAAGLAFYGLRQAPNQALTQRILRALAARLAPTAAEEAEPFEARTLGTILYGLSAREGSGAVRAILSAIAARGLCRGVSGVMDGIPLCNALYGLRWIGDSPESCAVLSLIAGAVAHRSGMDAQEACNGLYGLRLMGYLPEAQPIIEYIADALQRGAAEPGWRLRPVDVAAALYGISGMNTTPLVRRVLSILTHHVTRYKDTAATSQHLGNALYGLQRQGDTRECRAMLLALVPLVRGCTEPPSALDVCLSLYGLHQQTDNYQVRAMLEALVPFVRGCSDAPSGLTMANALYGVHRLGDAPPARAIVGALAGYVKACGMAPVPTEVGTAMYGLHSHADSREARQLIAAVAGRAGRAPTDTWTMRQVGAALYGLRGQNGTPESRTLLRTIIPMIRGSRLWDAGGKNQDLGVALFGLHGQGNTLETQLVLDALVPYVPYLTMPLDHKTAAQALHGLLVLAKGGLDVSGILPEIVRRVPRADQPDSNPRVQAALEQMLSVFHGTAPGDPVDLDALPQGAASCAIEKAVRAVLDRAGVPKMQYNVLHPTGFEMDLLSGSVNVELEGPSLKYRAAGHLRRKELRDQMLLRDCGISVVRIETTNRPLSDVIADVTAACRTAPCDAEAAAAWDRANEYAAMGLSAALAFHDVDAAAAEAYGG
eukprot:TRINITY_DN6642_c4_g1_i3.p1 TRINITY_DN6642_c4_g1~~TRINITY_DN6642_c4_g1_i3.p1  ORF type:complete len:861 (+),score=125.30 TRINITY_DN6642_c4_g1_i3:77-2659(+)